jgi:hypothetical protein
VDIGEAEEVADASSGRMVMNMQAGEQKKGKIEAKLDDLMWKFNLYAFCFSSWSWLYVDVCCRQTEVEVHCIMYFSLCRLWLQCSLAFVMYEQFGAFLNNAIWCFFKQCVKNMLY